MSEITQIDKVKLRDSVVQNLLALYFFVTLTATEEMFVYEDGIYVGNGKPEKIIKDETQKALGQDCTKYDVAEIIGTIQRKTFVNDDFFEDELFNHCIPIVNGILDLLDGTVVDFDPKMHFLSKLNIAYMPDLSCPQIDKFLHEILDSEADVQAIYEFIGYCLYRDYPIHKAFMFVGEGSNGKSTLLELMKRFLGSENVSNISLQDLSNRFAIAELRGKLANFYADLKATAIQDTGNFKMLTGNDSFSPEKKFIQRRIPFKNYAKFSFSCNKIPENKDDDTMAFWRRWQIFQFTKVFDDAHGNCDRNILFKLTENDEFCGLLCKAIEGLKRLLMNGKFSNEKGSDFTRKLWIKSDSVKAFIEECIEINLEGYEVKTKVYEAYRDFCVESGMIALDQKQFGHKFRSNIGYRDGQKTINGIKGIWCYLGVKMKEKTESKDSQIDTHLGDSNE